MTALGTKQRNALWNALSKWPAFQDANVRQFRMEHDVAAIGFTPKGIGDLPCVTITPTKLDTEWHSQLSKQFQFLFDITIYCRFLADAEQLQEDAIDAVHKCKSGNIYYYTAEGTNAYPPANLSSTVQPGAVGDGQNATPCWKVTITLGMRPVRQIVR